MLKFLVDHNVPKSVSIFLKKAGYNVKLVKDINPSMTDSQVVILAKKEDRIVITNDKDFISLSVQYSDVDMILFDYLNQSSDIRVVGLKQILPKLGKGFGVVVLQ